MILAISTSSPIVSVALFDDGGDLLAATEGDAQRHASRSTIQLSNELLAGTGRSLNETTLVAADLGPGSFSGTRVGIAIVKTLAFVLGVPVVGASSFDLIDPAGAVAVPCGRVEFLVRSERGTIERIRGGPTGDCKGYGMGTADRFPSAAAFGPLLAGLERLLPESLIPNYVLEPSITVPKRALGLSGG